MIFVRLELYREIYLFPISALKRLSVRHVLGLFCVCFLLVFRKLLHEATSIRTLLGEVVVLAFVQRCENAAELRSKAASSAINAAVIDPALVSSANLGGALFHVL